MSTSRFAPSSFLVALLSVAFPIAAAAQAQAFAAGSSHATQLKSALRAVAAAQARHHASKRSYATSVDQLALPAMPGVRVEILRVGRTGWHGRARHQDQPGRSCVIFVGRLDGAESPRTDEDRDMAGEEGVPLCDRMR